MREPLRKKRISAGAAHLRDALLHLLQELPPEERTAAGLRAALDRAAEPFLELMPYCAVFLEAGFSETPAPESELAEPVPPAKVSLAKAQLEIAGAEPSERPGVTDIRSRPARISFRDRARKRHLRAFERWTDEDDGRLRERFRGSESIPDLAAELGRQPNAVWSRAVRLGLVDDTDS